MKTLILVVIRLVIGYHFLYEGIDKLISHNWSSAPFLLQSNWIFSGFFHFLAGNQTILSIVDFMNIWGQILIGVALIIGLFSRIAAIFGAIMLLSYYIAIPPFVESFTFIDKNLFELFLFLVTILFPTSKIIGIDLLIEKYWGKKNG